MMTFLVWGSLLAALAAALWFQRRRRYRLVLRVPSARDDRVVCGGPCSEIEIAAGPDGFDLPEVVRRGQTAFLELRLRATAAAALREPFVEVTAPGIRLRQHLDRGVAGRRLVNVSPLFQPAIAEAPTRAGLVGHAVAWDREARLVLFDPPRIAGARTLVLAPHPDDAEIAAFGIYAANPSSSWIVTLTAGERGTADLSKVLPRGEDPAPWYARLRVWDSLAIPQLGGVPRERCLNLVYPDGSLESMHRDPATPFRLACEPALPRAALRASNRWPELAAADADCTWQGLVGELSQVLRETSPAIVISPHPVLEAHPDHVFTTVALEQALRATGMRPLLLLYAVHRLEARAHPFGPPDTWISPPPWNDAQPIADTLYSHALDPDARQAKFFAVEAAHDLRTYAAGNPPTVGELARAAKRNLSALISSTGVDPVTLQRRAPRPNEIYYVVGVDSLSALVQRALASARAGA